MSETAAPSAAPASGTGLPLFYKEPRVLEPGRHQTAGLVATEGMAFAAATNSLPIAADEFFAVQAHYPIVFTAGNDPAPVTVVGVFGDRNAFVDASGKWRAGAYVPAYVRRYPFIFVRADGEPERWLLAIDEAAEAYRKAEGRRFFEKDGAPSEATKQALAFCAAFQRQHEIGLAFARALAEQGLLTDYRAEVEQDGVRRTLSGFRIIDEAKFNALSDADFLEWRKRGFIALVYAQLASMLRWPALAAAARGGENA